MLEGCSAAASEQKNVWIMRGLSESKKCLVNAGTIREQKGLEGTMAAEEKNFLEDITLWAGYVAVPSDAPLMDYLKPLRSYVLELNKYLAPDSRIEICKLSVGDRLPFAAASSDHLIFLCTFIT